MVMEDLYLVTKGIFFQAQLCDDIMRTSDLKVHDIAVSKYYRITVSA